MWFNEHSGSFEGVKFEWCHMGWNFALDLKFSWKRFQSFWNFRFTLNWFWRPLRPSRHSKPAFVGMDETFPLISFVKAFFRIIGFPSRRFQFSTSFHSKVSFEKKIPDANILVSWQLISGGSSQRRPLFLFFSLLLACGWARVFVMCRKHLGCSSRNVHLEMKNGGRTSPWRQRRRW